MLKYPNKNQTSTTVKKTRRPLRWYLIFSLEFALVTYPVTHLPGSIELRINMIMEIIIGAKNPRVLFIVKTKDKSNKTNVIRQISFSPILPFLSSSAEEPPEKALLFLFWFINLLIERSFFILKQINEFVKQVFIFKIGTIESSFQFRRQIRKGDD